jgi:hypothetical protein
MEKLPDRDLWAVIDSVTSKPALVNDVPQIDLDLDDADDLTDLLNRLDREASASAKHWRAVLAVYMEMVKSRKGDVSDMTLAVLHDIRAATLD